LLLPNAENSLSSVRNRDRLKVLLFFFGALLFFSGLLLRIWFLSKAVDLAYETDNLTIQKEALEEENRKLSLEIARLKSPDRISRIATENLGMVRSPDAEVIILER
jgi:cell division protein FtsL